MRCLPLTVFLLLTLVGCAQDQEPGSPTDGTEPYVGETIGLSPTPTSASSPSALPSETEGPGATTPPPAQVTSTPFSTATPPPEETPAIITAACQLTCERPADCAGGGPQNGVDNFACDEGVCRWLGCHEGECQEGYECVDIYGGGIPSCVQSCQRPADCDLGSPSNDEDNYECEQNLCIWTGCNTDQECAFYGPGWTCSAQGGLSYCVPGCRVAADCALDSGTYSEDNYTCEEGACVWHGCNGTAECLASGLTGYSCVDF